MGTGGLKLSLASTDITPDPGVSLVCYRPRASTHVSHHLTAEALACRGEREAWILMAADVLGFEQCFVDALRRRIRELTGPRTAISIAGTHTHSGPATLLAPAEPLETELCAKVQECLEGVR